MKTYLYNKYKYKKSKSNWLANYSLIWYPSVIKKYSATATTSILEPLVMNLSFVSSLELDVFIFTSPLLIAIANNPVP